MRNKPWLRYPMALLAVILGSYAQIGSAASHAGTVRHGQPVDRRYALTAGKVKNGAGSLSRLISVPIENNGSSSGSMILSLYRIIMPATRIGGTLSSSNTPVDSSRMT
jgi:hypothetical protein